MPIQNLTTHVAPFVTVGELAAYWLVSPQQIRRQIETGALEAVRLGPRLYRIPVAAAIKFERRVTLVSRKPDEPPLPPQALPLVVRRKRGWRP